MIPEIMQKGGEGGTLSFSDSELREEASKRPVGTVAGKIFSAKIHRPQRGLKPG